MSYVQGVSTVSVGTNRSLIYGASQSGPMELVNLSTSVTIWIGYDTTIMVGSGPVVPLKPGASIAFDGTRTVYGIASDIAQLAIIPGGVSYSDSQPVVSPLFQSSGSVVIPVSSTVNIFPVTDISVYSSYDINMALVDVNQAVGGHALCCQVSIQWFDDITSTLPVYREVWNPWVMSQAPTGAQGIIGDGPMHGRFMSISVSNVSTGAVTMTYFNIFGSQRNVQVSDWRQCHGNHIAGLTFFNTIGLGFENSLYDTNGLVTAAASSTYVYPLFLYSGPATISVFTSNASINSVFLIDIGSNQNTFFSGTVPTNTSIIYSFPVSDGNWNAVDVDLPRSGCAVRLSISSVAGTFGLKAVARQGV
jgi:hypothetical protein